jgi:hypothetical protein
MSASPVLRRCTHLLLFCVILSCDRQSALEPRSDLIKPAHDVTAAVTQILVPDSVYRNTGRFIPLGDIVEGAVVTSVTDGMLVINHPPLTKVDFALIGPGWGCPPDTETCTPIALVSAGASVTLLMSRRLLRFGVEINPQWAGPQSYTATFLLGGVEVGSVTRTGVVTGAARLLAATSDAAFDQVLISGTAPFGIANIRYQAENAFTTLSPATVDVLFLRVAPGIMASSVPIDPSYNPIFVASGTPKAEPLHIAGAGEQIAVATTVLTRSLEIGNTGLSMLEYTAASPNGWITLAPAEGGVPPGGRVRLDATINASTLPLGASIGTITVSDPNALNTETNSAVNVTVQSAAALAFGSPIGPYFTQPLGTLHYFVLEVPEGLSDMSVRLRMGPAGSGDADLYVRYGDVPTLSTFDCRGFTTSSNETCTLATPRAGTYYVMTRAYSAYNDVTLDVVAGGLPIRPIITNVQYVSTSRLDLFWNDVSVNETSYRMQRRADGILGVWENLATLPPNTNHYADSSVVRDSTYRYRLRACNTAGCSPWTSSPSLTIPGPTMIVSPTALLFLFLRAGDGTALTSTAPSDGDARAQFTATGAVSSVTPKSSVMDVTIAETASGFFNFSAQYEAIEWTTTLSQPWLSVSPDHGILNANQTTAVGVTVDATSLAPGLHHSEAVLTDPNAANSPKVVPVFADIRLVPVLGNGNIVSGLSGLSGSVQYFMVTVPPNALRLTVRVFGETGAANVYVRQGAIPLTNKFDCAALETCTTNYPPAGVYYVMIHGATAFTGANLVATLGGAPAPPSALTTTVLTSASVNLTWTDASPNETYFAAQKRTFVADVWSAWSNAGTPAANATSHTFTGLTPETGYQFRIRSCNADGCSVWLTSPQVATPSAVPPAVPTPATATVVSATSITVGWTDVAYETSYQVQGSTQIDGVFGAYASIGSPTAGTVSLNDVVAAASTHRYRVRACNTHGCSAFSTSPVVTTPADAPPPAPATLSAVATSATQINLGWPDVAGETYYQVHRRIRVDGVFSSYTQIGTPSADATTFSDVELNPGGTYNHRIRACNALGCSAYKVGPLVTLPGS